MADPDNGVKPEKKYKILEKLKVVFWSKYEDKPQFKRDDDDVDNPYIKNRLERFINFFDSERKKNRDKERRLQYLIIGFGALIPVVNVFGIPSPFSNILSSVFGGIVVVSTGFLQFEKYHERWLISKTTATKLTNEYYYWKNKVGEYTLNNSNHQSVIAEEKEKAEKRLALLVRNCEYILLSEATEFVGLFNTRDRITGKDNKPP
jgi:hypothetical protein